MRDLRSASPTEPRGDQSLVVTHTVVGWLHGKTERADILGLYATNVTDHVAADGSNDVAITADIHDMAGLQALMDSPSPEDAAAEERHGVIQPFAVYIEKSRTGLQRHQPSERAPRSTGHPGRRMFGRTSARDQEPDEDVWIELELKQPRA